MGRKALCARCSADPLPSGFGSPRSCAFDAEGSFTSDNWNCATLNALPVLPYAFADTEGCGADDGGSGSSDLHGDDESLQIVACGPWRNEDGGEFTSGWVVLTRYKHRGKCSSAVWVGDFWPPVPLTLAMAEGLCAGRIPRAAEPPLAPGVEYR
jgi:hypothetical protein